MLTQSLPDTYQSFNEFVNWYPEDSVTKYELREGGIIEIPRGSGDRSQVWGNIRSNIGLEPVPRWRINRQNGTLVDKVTVYYFV